MTKEIVFAGSGHGGIVAFKSLQKEFDHIEVVSQDEDIHTLMRRTDVLIDKIEDSDLNIVVCAAYTSIISEEILNKKTIINTHPSLLPKYRGMHSLVWAMLNFEKELGFTIHLMNENIDDGDILEQFKIKYENQTSYEIMSMFDEYIENNLGKIVKNYINKEITPVKQDKTKATWVCKRNITDCIIDFNKSNKYIHMLFKALVRPYPLPMIQIKDKLYEVCEYNIITINYEMHLGRVVNIENNKVYIKIREGILIINTLINFETKGKIKASNILKIGQRL